jgi:hypothetical protein
LRFRALEKRKRMQKKGEPAKSYNMLMLAVNRIYSNAEASEERKRSRDEKSSKNVSFYDAT